MKGVGEMLDLYSRRAKAEPNGENVYIDIQQPDPEGKAVTLKEIVEKPGNKYVLVDFWASWCSPCREEMPFVKKAYDECAGSLEFMPYMDGGLVSFLAGRTKPDPEMYRMFLLKYGLRADECVFIDDTEENVEAAKVLGFSGIVFHDYENLLRALSDLGLTELNKTLG